MTDHPLDSPLWHDLGGSLASYSRVVGGVRFLDPEFATVAAMQHVTPANVTALISAMPLGSQILVIAPEPIEVSAELDVVDIKPLLQMVAERLVPIDGVAVAELKPANLPQMLALVDLARPGPLGRRAFDMGSFRGIFDGETLVAMAGERLHLDGFTEIASVCTHPDFRGRGYGKFVVSAVAQVIVDSGQTPFLGVNADNVPAIRLYEGLGFRHTRTLHLNFVRRPSPQDLPQPQPSA